MCPLQNISMVSATEYVRGVRYRLSEASATDCQRCPLQNMSNVSAFGDVRYIEVFLYSDNFKCKVKYYLF